jgi:hypothetical protein
MTVEGKVVRPINRLDKDNPQGYKRILVVGDLHSGSNVSVKHPEMVLNKDMEGQEVATPLNGVQERQYQEWVHMCEVVGKVDLVIHMGDMCDGVNYRGEGLGTWTTSIEDQVRNAVKLLKEIDADKHLGVRGTPYHTKLNKAADDVVMERMGSTKIDWDMRLEVEDIVFNLRHWIATTKSVFMYRPTKIAREMLLLMQSKHDLGTFDFLIRGHVHTTMYLDMKDSMGMIGLTTPCWKARDEFVRSKITGSSDQGWYLFDVDGDKFTRYNRCFRIPIKFNIKTVRV